MPPVLRHRRLGRINGIWIGFLCSMMLLSALILMLVLDPNHHKPVGRTLIVYCAPAVKKPVAAIAQEYERATGVTIQLDYGPSQTLLTRVEMSKTGDLFIPADDSYLTRAAARELVEKAVPLARMKPVLVVGKEDPKHIASVPDLFRADVRVSVAEPGAAIHKIVEQALTASGDWPRLNDKALMNGTVADVANAVTLGSVDAGFIWDGMLPQYPALRRIILPQLANAQSQVAAGVLRSSKQPAAALRFARYLAAPDKGQTTFKENGYDVPDENAPEAPTLRSTHAASPSPRMAPAQSQPDRTLGASR